MHITTAPHRRHRALAAGLLTLAVLLAGCGGDDEAASDGTTAPTEASVDDGTSTDGGGTDDGSTDTTTADDGTSDLDLCAEITQADMEAILPEAAFTSVSANDVTPAPTCEYRIDIGGIEASVVQILLAAEEADYLDGQREIQADAVDVPGIEDAFAFDDFGTIFVRNDLGVFLIERGVELTSGGEAASQDQMVAIAELVAAL
jgi:hypothetical protein